MNFKYYIFLLFATLTSSFISAQKSFVVDYEQVSIPRFLNDDGSTQKLEKDLLESLSRPTLYELQINDKQSFYSEVERINNSQSGNSITFIGLLPKNLFLDFESNVQKREWELESKKYIVLDSIKTEKYQLTREKSTYLGYTVKQAVKEDEEGKVVVWYAPDLPAKFGPSTYINFPGLVLKVEYFSADSSESTFSLKATSVKIKEDLKFSKLFKGKEISAAEFKIIEENYNKKFSEPQGVDKS